MIYSKRIRQFILASAAGLALYFAPISGDDQQVSAAEGDFSSTELREVANKYKGVPYSYGGTTTSGFDCSGFVLTVFNEFDISLPRTSSTMYSVGEKVDINELLPGDLVFFKTMGNGRISHVGIYYGGGKFIHSQNGEGVSLSDISGGGYWSKHYAGAKRVANVQLVAKN